MTVDDQVRALGAVKLLTAIRRYRPHLFVQIQEFRNSGEFPASAAVSRKDSENQLRRVALSQDQDHRGQQASDAGEVL